MTSDAWIKAYDRALTRNEIVDFIAKQRSFARAKGDDDLMRDLTTAQAHVVQGVNVGRYKKAG